MEVEYELTLPDLGAFQRFYLKHGPKAKPRPLGKALSNGFKGFIALLAFLVYWFTVHPVSDWLSGCCIGVILGILLTLVFGILFGLLARSSRLRMLGGEESQWMLARRRFKIAADGFEITNEFHRLHYSWAVVWLIDCTQEHAFFCTSAKQAHLIPRRAFLTLGDFGAFIDLACRYHKGLPPRESTTTEILDALPVKPSGITIPRHPENQHAIFHR